MAVRYDTLVLCGGMAGLPLALSAARHGRVLFVGKEKLGRTCLNRGCIPTKTMIASAAVAQQGRRAAEFGVHTPVPVSRPNRRRPATPDLRVAGRPSATTTHPAPAAQTTTNAWTSTRRWRGNPSTSTDGQASYSCRRDVAEVLY
jgi:hypothetical protein